MASKAYLGLALLCGLGAFGLSRGYAERLNALRPDPGPIVQVAVASHAVARGTTLAPDDVEIRSIPSTFAPPGAYRSQTQVVGRVLTSDIAAGEALTASRLAAARSGPVAALVPPGLRAVVVDAGVPAETLHAGDRVDVLATYGGDRSHVETVADSLEVLSILEPSVTGGLTPGASGGGAQVVLLTSPSVAEQLAYARAFAILSVSIEPAPGSVPFPTPTP